MIYERITIKRVFITIVFSKVYSSYIKVISSKNKSYVSIIKNDNKYL